MNACPACRAEVPRDARFCPACGTRLFTAGLQATERKVVTTLFADLVGFTALGERHDPEDIDAALRGFYALARTIIERFGGVVEKFIGDAAVGLFGVPLAHEDDAERAVRAALEIVSQIGELPSVRGEPLRVRCAVNTGPALVRPHARPETGEGVLVGDATNTAARLLSATSPMTVTVGAGTHDLTQRTIKYEYLSDLTAKGKAEPVERWTAVRAIARYGTDPDRRDDSPMIGREVELAVLAGLLDRAIASHSPQYAVVSGEAGVGKSRLVREFFRLVDARSGTLCNWRQGGCPPYGSSLAYWSLREVVSAHAGIVPGETAEAMELKLRAAATGTGLGEWLMNGLLVLMGLPAPSRGRDENFAAWTRFFESIAEVRPAVVVIEDMHWASESTLEFLLHFVTHASDVPLLLIGTARPELFEAHPDVLRLPGVENIELKALSPDESSRLAEALLKESGAPGFTRQVAEHCGGNPLFAEELARFLTERDATTERPGEVVAQLEAPTSILALIAARLDALPPAQKDLLSDASVIGPVFWPAALAAVQDASSDDVETTLGHLEQRQFVRRHNDSSMHEEIEFSFWHMVVRDVAYGRLPRFSRAARHLRVARWLEKRTADSDDFAEIVAHHYETGMGLAHAAGQDTLVHESKYAAQCAFARAGDRALRLDVAAAERYFRLAAEMTEDGDLSRSELLLKRGEALRLTGRFLDAASLQKEAILLLEAAGDVQGLAYALSRLAFTLSWIEPEESRLLAEQAVDMLDGTAGAEAIAVLETWATLQLWRADLAEVLNATDRILATSRSLRLPSPARALSLHGYARFILGDPDGLTEMVDAIDLAEKSGSAGELFGLRDVYARCTCVVEDPERSLESVRQWISEAEQRKDATTIVDLEVYAARYLLLCARWDEALGLIADLTEEGRRRELRVTEAELCAIAVAAHVCRGTPQAATGDAGRFEALLPEISPVVPRLGNIAVAAYASALDQRARARTLLEQLLQTSFASEPSDVLWWPLAVRSALDMEERALARRIADVALRWPTCPTRVRRTLTALLAEYSGRPADAALDYETAAGAWRLGKSPHDGGHCLLGLGRCLLALGRRAEALRALEDARVLFESVGSRLALAEVEIVLQAGGV